MKLRVVALALAALAVFLGLLSVFHKSAFIVLFVLVLIVMLVISIFFNERHP